MLKNNFLTLILLFMAKILVAQVIVTGTVNFAFDGANQPVPGWHVDFYMGPDALVASAETNDEGYYEIVTDVTFGGSPPWYVQTFDICTGDVITVEWDPDPDVIVYEADFVLCEGIEPPPPPNGCDAFFFSEQQAQTDQGIAVAFYDLSYHSEGVDSWEWTFGDGGSSTEQNPVHLYAEAGEYLVTLVITGNIGDEICTSTVQQAVVVYDPDNCNCPTDEVNPVCVFSPSGEIFEFITPCFAECAGFGPDQYQPCDDGCNCPTDEYDPVCVLTVTGELITFTSPCYAECAGYGPDEYEACDGECVCPEFYAPVCVTADDGTIITFDNHCFAECEGYGPDQWFECDPDECECTDEYDPVCVEVFPGFEITFNNACEAECAGFAPGDYQECGSECICPEFYDPVCVVLDDGQVLTFDNFCFAQCEGYGPEQWTSCDNGCECPEDLYDPVCVATPSGQIITFINPCEAECAGFSSDIYYSCDGEVCSCPEYWDPVCVIGPDGDIITFSNPCFAECEDYGPDQYFECDPDGCECPDIYDPVCVSGFGGLITFPNACIAICEGFGPEDFVDCENECDCSDFFGPPVCVSIDGDPANIIPFFNACYAECAGFSEADFVDCGGDCVCPAVWDPVCVINAAGVIVTYGNECEAACDGYTPDNFVDCENDCICPTVWDPVCISGEAGLITFPNECIAICEGFSPEDFVACEDECICDDVWDPVCVIDVLTGVVITYGNECEAACFGYTPDDFVECEEDCVCPAIWDPVCVTTDDGFVISFPSPCEAECAGYGPDQYFDCGGGCECPDVWDPVCVNGIVGTITFPNACVALCEGFTDADFVECDTTCECDDFFLPVCVIDPATGDVYEFINPCYAACEGYSSDDIVPCFPSDDCWAEFTFDIVSEDGLTVQFTDLSYTSDEITSWSWNFGDGETSTEQNPIHTYAEGGIYDVSLTISSELCGDVETIFHLCVGDGGGVGGPICQSFFFFEQPDADNLLLFQFIDLSFSDVNAWVWDFGDGNTSTEQNPTHEYAEAGDYVVSLTVFAEECQSTVSMPVTAGENIWYGELDCRAWFLPINNTDNNEVFFINLSSPDAVEFTWDFGDGQTSTDPLALHEYEEAGTYTVTLTIVTESGCTNSFSTTVDLGTDGFTSDPTFSIVSSTDEAGQLTALQAAPNPSNGLVRISWDAIEAGDYSWQVFDINGRLVQQDKDRSVGGSIDMKLDLSKEASGIYLFRLQTPDGIKTLRLSKF